MMLASTLGWPDAVATVAGCALFAIIIWRMT